MLCSGKLQISQCDYLVSICRIVSKDEAEMVGRG